MPVDRRDLSGQIGPGNFGSRGTPLGLTPGKKGPNLGRLLNALGGAAGVLKEQAVEEENTRADEAELRTRQAILENTSAKENETPEQHRQRIQAAVDNVKFDFKEKSTKAQFFTEGNRALEAIDNIYTTSRSQVARNQILALHENMKGAPAEDILAETDNIISREFLNLDGLTDSSKVAFLKNVNKFAIDMHDRTQSQAAQQAMAEGLQKNSSVNFAEGVEAIEGVTGVALEEMTKSIEGFDAWHTTADNNVEQITQHADMSTQRVFNNALALSNGNRKVAGDAAVQHAITLAKRTGRPEILDSLFEKDLSGKRGEEISFKKFYSQVVDDTKRQIVSNLERTKRSLQDQKKSELVASNREQYAKLKIQTSTNINTAIGSEDPEFIKETHRNLKDQLDSVLDDFSAGKYRGNEAQAATMIDYIESAKKTLINSEGTPEGNEAFEAGMSSGGWTKSDHNRWVDKLSPEYKRKSWEYIQPQLALEKNQIQNKIAIDEWQRKTALQNTVNQNLVQWQQFSQQNETLIESMSKIREGEGQFGGLKALTLPSVRDIQARMNSEVQGAMLRLSGRILETETRPPTPEEAQDAIKPIIDKYDKLFQQQKDTVDVYKKAVDFTEKQTDVIEGRTDEGKRMQESLDKARSGDLKAEETSNVYEAAQRGVATPDDVKVALITDIKANDFSSMSEALQFVADRFTFDLRDPQAKSFLREVLKRGFEQKTMLRRHIPTSVLQERPEDMVRGGGQLFTVGSARGSNQLGDETMGKILEQALEDNKLVTRSGLKKFLDDYPFNTWPNANNPDMSKQEIEAERKKLRDEEVEKIMSIFSDVNKKLKE